MAWVDFTDHSAITLGGETGDGGVRQFHTVNQFGYDRANNVRQVQRDFVTVVEHTADNEGHILINRTGKYSLRAEVETRVTGGNGGFNELGVSLNIERGSNNFAVVQGTPLLTFTSEGANDRVWNNNFGSIQLEKGDKITVGISFQGTVDADTVTLNVANNTEFVDQGIFITKLDVSDEEIFNPISFKYNKGRANEVRVASLIDRSGAPIRSAPGFVNFRQVGDNIHIDHIAGLRPNKNYRITFGVS